MSHETSRAALAEMAQGRTQEDYIALIWSQRYPHPSPAASTGWPYLPTSGLVEMPSKVRKIK